jgi:hypothetical protein
VIALDLSRLASMPKNEQKPESNQASIGERRYGSGTSFGVEADTVCRKAIRSELEESTSANTPGCTPAVVPTSFQLKAIEAGKYPERISPLGYTL